MKLSELITEYRKRMSISQREFSRKCDLSNTYISFLENEKNPKTGKPIVPTLEQYKKLADGMDISVQRLFELLDSDSPVSMLPPPDDPPYELPKNDDVRLLIQGLNRLPPEQIEQARNIMKTVFVQYAKYFEKEENTDGTEL